MDPDATVAEGNAPPLTLQVLSEVRSVLGQQPQCRVGVLRTSDAWLGELPEGANVVQLPLHVKEGGEEAPSSQDGGTSTSGPADEEGSSGAMALVARNLFSALRQLDALGCGVVVVEGVPETGQGVAIMNRLRKAAGRTVEA